MLGFHFLMEWNWNSNHQFLKYIPNTFYRALNWISLNYFLRLRKINHCVAVTCVVPGPAGACFLCRACGATVMINWWFECQKIPFAAELCLLSRHGTHVEIPRDLIFVLAAVARLFLRWRVSMPRAGHQQKALHFASKRVTPRVGHQ